MSAELTGYAIWYPRCDNSYEAVDAEPVTPLPFRMLIEMRLGGSDFAPAALRPNDTAAALRGASTSGVWKSRTAAWIAADDVDSSFVPCRSPIFDWKKCPDGRPYAKSAYRRIVFSSEPLPAWPIS